MDWLRIFWNSLFLNFKNKKISTRHQHQLLFRLEYFKSVYSFRLDELFFSGCAMPCPDRWLRWQSGRKSTSDFLFFLFFFFFFFMHRPSSFWNIHSEYPTVRCCMASFLFVWLLLQSAASNMQANVTDGTGLASRTDGSPFLSLWPTQNRLVIALENTVQKVDRPSFWSQQRIRGEDPPTISSKIGEITWLTHKRATQFYRFYLLPVRVCTHG